MSARDDLEKFMTPASRALVDQFMAESAEEADDDVDMDEVIRQNLAAHEAALTGDGHAMCEDTIAALQEELRLRAGRIRALEAELPNLVSICCHQVYGGPHTMACRRYSGPIDHWRVYTVPDVIGLAVRGLAECTCGVRYPAAGEGCPNRAETWRGPKPEDAS